MGIWTAIATDPGPLADRYEALWTAQLGRGRAHYLETRDAFNRDPEPAALLYLLARCVKNAVRFNAQGAFNQSADHRRKGRHPTRMRRALLAAHALLRGRTTCTAGDYRTLLAAATPDDVVYLDPPYQGTSHGRDKRYVSPLDLPGFLDALADLQARDVPHIVSFDGRCGTRSYGEPLPECLGLPHVEVETGRSSQATLGGRRATTVESLYLSHQFGVEGGVQRLRAASGPGVTPAPEEAPGAGR